MAGLRRGGAARKYDTRRLLRNGAAGHPLALRLAREELGRLAARDGLADGLAGGSTLDRYLRAYRALGVVLRATAPGLRRLDEYVYRPLRDAAFLTAKLMADELHGRIASGTQATRAFETATGSWLEDFGLVLVDGDTGQARPDLLFEVHERGGDRISGALNRHRSAPNHLDLVWRAREAAAQGRLRLAQEPYAAHERERRMLARREVFSACDADFRGPGEREIVRAIFATALMLVDQVVEYARSNPRAPFADTCGDAVDGFKTVTARLVAEDY